jgi:hypothetical protein
MKATTTAALSLALILAACDAAQLDTKHPPPDAGPHRRQTTSEEIIEMLAPIDCRTAIDCQLVAPDAFDLCLDAYDLLACDMGQDCSMPWTVDTDRYGLCPEALFARTCGEVQAGIWPDVCSPADLVLRNGLRPWVNTPPQSR